MKNNLNASIATISSFALTALICLSLPVSTIVHSSDLEIYQTSTPGETRIMFVLDTSQSMSYDYSPTRSFPNLGCDLPSGVTASRTGNDTSSSSFNGTTIPTYSRYYCLANRTNINSPKTYSYKRQIISQTTAATSSTTIYRCGSSNSGANATVAAPSSCTNTGVISEPSNYCALSPVVVSGNTTTTYYYDRNGCNGVTGAARYRYRTVEVSMPSSTVTTNSCSSSSTVTCNYQYYSCPTNATSLTTCTTTAASPPSGAPSTNESCGTGCLAYYNPEQSTTAPEKYYDRITKLKDGLYDVLLGRNAVNKLKDSLVAGLTDFSGGRNRSGELGSTGQVLVVARALNASAASTSGCTGNSQRECILKKIADMQPNDYTPTGNAYAVGAKSLLDTVGNDSSTCNGNGVYVLTDGGPTASRTISNTQTTMASAINGFTCPTGFSPDSTNANFTYEFKSREPDTTDNDQIWRCIAKFNNNLLTGTVTRPKIKTAIVGFGSFYEGLPEYTGDRTDPTQVSPRNIDIQNILDIYNNITNFYGDVVGGSSRSDIANTALWGIYGKGGWYSASEPAQVASSILNFVEAAGGEVPAVSTGTATIPVDALYSTQIQPYAYYAQFDPKPETADTLWLGNMKKYDVFKNIIGKKTGTGTSAAITSLVDSDQKLRRLTDLWAKSDISGTTGSISLQGGMLSQLPVGSMASGGTAEISSTRKIYSNRTITAAQGATPASATANNTVNSNLTAITAAGYIDSEDPDKAYLYSLMGYNLAEGQFTNPSTIDATLLAATPRFTKAGMILHSRPVLLTQKGKVSLADDGKTLTTDDRKDYALFGSTQGVLHVVDAESGVEKFAFVPNEMIAAQKEYFKKDVVQQAGSPAFKYGIDGPWTAYTEYVPTTSGGLTVGSGKVASLNGKQWVYGGLRMGGRSYYALDLGDMDNPKLKFHINPTGTGSSTDPLGYMGQSWSKPSIAWVNWNGARKLVMFVGGGYDAGYEDPAYNPTKAKGNGVYMFDANNGKLLWWASSDATSRGKEDGDTDNTQATNNANLNYSIVSKIKTIDRNSDGLVDHLYFGDLGGQAFRVDIDNRSSSTAFAKRVVRILDLHNAALGPRFYEVPALTIHNGTSRPFAVVSFGSGNRSKPMFPREPTQTATWTTGEQSYINDGVYAVFDKDVAKTNLYTTTDTANLSNLSTHDVVTGTTGNTLLNIDRVSGVSEANGGWYYRFVTDTTVDSYNTRKQVVKVFEEPVAIGNDLYVSVFDSSKSGISGTCGAGVKGESFVHRFCLPYGGCGRAATNDTFSLGVGIQGIPIGAGDDDDLESRGIVFTNDDKKDTAKNSNALFKYSTPTKLIPQRWYEKYAQ